MSEENIDETKRESSESKPLPDGYKRYVVISKDPPRTSKKRKGVHKEIKEDELTGVIDAFEQLHKDVHKLAEDTRNLKIECCNYLNFSCLKFKPRVKAEVKVKDAKATVV